MYVYASIFLWTKPSCRPYRACVTAFAGHSGRSQLYEDAIRPFGLLVSQHSILQVFSRAGEVSRGQLSQTLAMATTGQTRTLAIMIRQKARSESAGSDFPNAEKGCSQGRYRSGTKFNQNCVASLGMGPWSLGEFFPFFLPLNLDINAPTSIESE